VAVLALRANFAGFPTLFFQIVFSLESARSDNSMYVGTCTVMDIEAKYFKAHLRNLIPTNVIIIIKEYYVF
jgi:hypothetical protein